MGNCPSGNLMACPFYSSFWIDQNKKLPPLGGDLDSVTISGFSSGSFLSTNLHVVHSDLIKGVALINGGPYGFDWNRNETMFHGRALAKMAEDLGLIANTTNLKDSTVLIMSGRNDLTTPTLIQKAQRQFYEGEGANVEFVETDFGHLMSIDKPIDELWPYSDCLSAHHGGHAGIHNCQFDQAGFILNNLFTRMDPNFELNPRDLSWRSKGILREFDQHEFLGEHFIYDFNGFHKNGYIFYPYQCLDKDKKCKIHVFFHGCYGTAKLIGQVILRNIGFIEYAVTNDLIILFPQNTYNLDSNLMTCWSTNPWILPDDDYFNQNGLQQNAIRKMIERIGQSHDVMADIDSHEAWNIAYDDPGIVGVDDLVTIELFIDNFDWLIAAILTWGFWFL